jgi:ubiquinone/menaquinone biosynthesis C-methylase UbiE
MDERLNARVDSPWRGEHFFRYEYVERFIEPEDRVLDLACGEGYGTYRIAQRTSGEVVGCDIAEEALAYCRDTWQRSNLSYRVVDGTALDFPDAYFDKVVSFETIEHTTEYESMLREFYRVLRPGGTAFISTPNFPISSPKGYVENPYHTQEWHLEELSSILSGVFDSVEIFGQQYSRFEKRGALDPGKLTEWFFNQRVIRRLPLAVKDRVSFATNGKPFYPQEDDFTLVSDEQEVRRCMTFFCICKKERD